MHFQQFDNGALHSLLGKERFSVCYRLDGDEPAALDLAKRICVEQTVEFPFDALPQGDIPDTLVGRMERFQPLAAGGAECEISYAVELLGGDPLQFLNVLFGNISILDGIRITDFSLPLGARDIFRGPRFGTDGIRARTGVKGRPLLFTALKPIGLSPKDFAALSGQFVRGGVDVVKDDHGIVNQAFSPFEERVARCSEAVARANAETGAQAIYVPNVTCRIDELVERAFLAKELGAGGVMVAPGLVGFDAIRQLADAELGLPIFSHPAFSGSYAVNPQGIAPDVLYGRLARLFGADASIFPNYGGRFSFTKEQCVSIRRRCEETFYGYPAILPAPAGGMQIARIADMLDVYGNDVLILIGGGLFTAGPDVNENCRAFRELVETQYAAHSE